MLVDAGVEHLLDHAVLEGQPEFAFGVLVGRFAVLSVSQTQSQSDASAQDGGNRQFLVTHAFPIDRRTTSMESGDGDGAGDVDEQGSPTGLPAPASPGFFRHLDNLLVGGLRVVGFYQVWSPSDDAALQKGTMRSLESVSRAAFPDAPMTLLEKTHGSHAVKVRSLLRLICCSFDTSVGRWRM